MSNLSSVYNTALAGMSAAAAQFEASAAKIATVTRTTANASGTGGLTEIVGPLTDIVREQAVYTANAAVVRVADQMTGTLLDMVDDDADRHHADRWE